jgi:O-6-methylguanine DNA methyltransferase
VNITLTNLPPQHLKELLKTNPVFYGYHQLPIGTLFICTLNNSIIAAAFCDDSTTTEETILKKFPNAQPCDDQHLTQVLNQPTLNIITTGTDFQNNVWQAATHIPAGSTATYQQLAAQLNNPTAFRAVANALADNNIAYFIPCHRIVRTDGDLGGYKWGVATKSALLDFEKQV